MTVTGTQRHFDSPLPLLVWVLVMCLAAATASADDRVATYGGSLVAGGDRDFSPYEFIGPDGRPAGYNVDVFRAVARVMGLDARIKLGSWAEMRHELETGQISLLMGMFQSAARDRVVDFSRPHLIIHHGIFVRKGSSIRSLKDLSQKEIIVQQGDIMDDYAHQKGLSENIVLVGSQVAGLRLLASGSHDCFLGAKLQALALLRKHGLDNVVTVGDPFYPRNYGFAVTEGNTELLLKLNEGLAIIKQTGAFDAIYDKWFGVIGAKGPLGTKVVRTLAWTLGAVLVVLAFSALWLRALRRQVAVKTRDLQRELAERRKAEQRLQKRESVLNATLESTLDGVLVVAADGSISQYNSRFAEIWGIPEDILALRDDQGLVEYVLPQLMAPDDFMRKIKALYRTTGNSQDVIQLKDGRVLERLSYPLIKDGRGSGRVWFFRDISKRIRTEKALKESEEKYRQLVQASPAGIYELDMEKMAFLSVNEVMCRYSGYSREEIMALDPFSLVAPEDLEIIQKRIRDAGATAGPGSVTRVLDPMEFTIRGKDGRQVQLLFNSKVFFQDAVARRAMVVAHDVSALRAAEAEAKRLEERLQEVQKIEALGTLAGGIAHNFNNLLMGIQGNISLAMLDQEARSAPFARLKHIEQYIRQGGDLTNQLLGLARGGKYQVQPTDINALVKSNIEIFARTRREIQVHGKYLPSLWPALADSGQIEQALLNLFVNASQAMPNGGSIYLETANTVMADGDVAPHGIIAGRYVCLSVRDTGGGMDQETQRRIFDPFFTTKAVGKGSGLGLASVYGIVKNHGGMVQVASAPGKGSTFSIYLPASEKKALPQVSAAPESMATGTGTVLLIDDEPMILDVGRQMLESLGYGVITADSGQGGVSVFEKEKETIRLVVLDMIMPDMGGGEAFDRLKALDPQVRVLLASGYSIDGQASAILAQGCSGFIQKPFTLTQFSKKIREAMADGDGLKN